MSPRAKGRTATSAALAALLALCVPRHARAEDSLSYIFENYREEDGRITVETQGASADQDLPDDLHIGLSATMDAVAGATPTGRPAPPGSGQVVLTEIHTRRKAWSGDLTRAAGHLSVDAGFAESRESDYVSRGWSLNTIADFDEKNTLVRAGVAGTDDRVEVFFEPAYLPKHSNDAILGVTQLLGPLTTFTLNASLGRSWGYLSEPHKDVEKSVEILPNIFLAQAFGENSPNERNRESLLASLNRAFPGAKGALEGSYRIYGDSYGITSSTAEISWLQHVPGDLILAPMVRGYVQTAARFYYYNLDDTPIVPVQIPVGAAPYYSSDFRLSAEETLACGLKAIWRPRDRLRLVASYSRYEMRGRDGVTPQSAYPRAGISSVEATLSW
jgi:hypothetical protein